MQNVYTFKQLRANNNKTSQLRWDFTKRMRDVSSNILLMEVCLTVKLLAARFKF
jgi:hypothetical protein